MPIPGPLIIRVVGLSAFATTPTLGSDVPGMSCSEIGSFARHVAEQKAEGVAPQDEVRRLRQSLGAEYPGTARELEKIITAIYSMKILATSTPEEVGTAYQTACEM